MYDTGNLKLFAAQLPQGALERPVPALGWTVRQVFAHLAAGQIACAASLERLATGSATLTAEDFDQPRNSADRAVSADARPLPTILEDFDSSLRRLVAQLNLLTGEALEAGVEDVTVLAVLHGWSDHAAGHAIQLLEAVPELRGDPMLLNWLLYQDFSREPAQFTLQQTLFEEVRERHAHEDDEMIEEEIE